LAKFSRATVIEACASLESLTHAQLDRFMLRFGLEEVAPQSSGSKTDRANELIKYLINNPEDIGPSGANLTFEIVEEIVAQRVSDDSSFGFIARRPIEEQLPRLVNSLKHDGYVISNGKLESMLPQDIHLVEKEDELSSLLQEFRFLTPKGHLEQAISAHTRGDWASANAQMRTFIESLFNSIAEVVVRDKQLLPTTSYQRRELLAKLDPPFLLVSLNEWEIGTNGGFLQGFWRRLHTQGAHPGLSDEEDSTFRLHLVILIASHYMKRLSKWLGSA
jgi:hypothetical protein